MGVEFWHMLFLTYVLVKLDRAQQTAAAMQYPSTRPYRWTSEIWSQIMMTVKKLETRASAAGDEPT
jgi:hypothetical protein